MTGIIDTWIVYRVLRIMTTPWDEMDAFKLGIIDANGKSIKKSKELKTTDEKNAYTLLHRLVFNLKRILEKLPFGKTKLARYATALFLIKEHMETKRGKMMLEEGFKSFISKYAQEKVVIREDVHPVGLAPGRYKILNPMLDSESDVVKAGSIFTIRKQQKGTKVMGVEVFSVVTTQGQELAVSHEDIESI